MITHAVYFSLRHPPGSEAEQQFLVRSQATLAAIPGVWDFSMLRQTNAGAPWAFGFAMAFADQAAYDAYNAHPQHLAYVRDVWAHEVAEFQEIDTVEL